MGDVKLFKLNNEIAYEWFCCKLEKSYNIDTKK
jgi:hypothetical protein